MQTLNINHPLLLLLLLYLSRNHHLLYPFAALRLVLDLSATTRCLSRSKLNTRLRLIHLSITKPTSTPYSLNSIKVRWLLFYLSRPYFTFSWSNFSHRDTAACKQRSYLCCFLRAAICWRNSIGSNIFCRFFISSSSSSSICRFKLDSVPKPLRPKDHFD